MLCCISIGLDGQKPPKVDSTQLENINFRKDVLGTNPLSNSDAERSFQEQLKKDYGVSRQYETATRRSGLPSEYSGGIPTMDISKYNKGVSALHVGSPIYSSQEDDNTSMIIIIVGVAIFTGFFLLLIFGTKKRWESGDDENEKIT